MDRIVIDSRDRVSSSLSSSDFEVVLANTVKVRHIKLESIWIPGSIYNIQTPNNVLVFTDTTQRSITITPGLYTGSQLATQLQTQMNTAYGSDVYTVTYLGAPNYQLSWAISSGTFQIMSNSTTPWNALGLLNSTTTAAANLTSTYPVSLDRPYNLFVSIQDLDRTVYTSSAQFSACFAVPVIIAQDSLYQPLHEEFTLPFDSKIMQRIRCRLLQQDGTVVNLNNGDWTVCMLVSGHDEPDRKRKKAE